MEQQRPYFRRMPAAEEEEKVWVSFYRNANDPDLAAELIAHMDKDVDSRTRYPGLYLRCKQSMRRQRQREARAKRVANAVRVILRSAVLMVLMPAGAVASIMRSIRALARFSGDVALDVCDGGATPTRPSKAPAKRASSASKRSCPPGASAAQVGPVVTPDHIAKSA
ncbi:hypothetical protein [Duganella vulcania]|uniref:Uncharacterized protein n=1 Tax=Duganella vulcania TaxID=2692166 RepID=A0A845GRM0_9BURK|nr:hypothetical protein [Duganella vulcania]MYM95896.1 hypothetical protein [Duganella vulcania]